jgi:cytochrome c5
VEHGNHDKIFFKSFAMVMGALFAIFFICIAVARIITPAHEVSAEDLAKIEDRIKPVGQVVTDPAALMKLAAASAAARAPYTGEQLVQKVCSGCHAAGLLGAPKIGDKGEWSKRMGANGGLAGLVASAAKGKNSMPARGGDPSLSDAELKAAIEILIK